MKLGLIDGVWNVILELNDILGGPSEPLLVVIKMTPLPALAP